MQGLQAIRTMDHKIRAGIQMSIQLLYPAIFVSLNCILTVTLCGCKEKNYSQGAKENRLPSKSNPEVTENIGPGRLEFLDPLEKDLGVCRPNYPKKTTFEVQNVGGNPIKLWVDSSTCLCMVGGANEVSVKQNERVAIVLTWKSPSSGEFSYRGTIKTDISDQPEFTPIVRARVGQPFVFDPPQIALGSFYSQKELVIPAMLLSLEDEEFSFRTHRLADADLQEKIICESEPARRLEPNEFPNHPGAKWLMELKIKVKPRIPFGEINTELCFTNIGQTGIEVLPYAVFGKSLYPLGILAADQFDEKQCLLNLGTHRVQDGLAKNLIVEIRETDLKRGDLKVASIDPPSLKDILEIQIGPPKKSPTRDLFPVSIKIPPGAPPIELTGRYENDFGKVVLETGLLHNPYYELFLKLKLD